MFITRFTFEQRMELQMLREEVRRLSIQIASKDATNEWLMTRVNSLEVERAALTERMLQVSYPVPQIQRINERAAGKVESYGVPLSDDDYAIPSHLKGAVAPHPRMADPAPRPRPASDEVGGSISALQAQAAFEDMGDEAAAEAGIIHDDAGAVRHTR